MFVLGGDIFSGTKAVELLENISSLQDLPDTLSPSATPHSSGAGVFSFWTLLYVAWRRKVAAAARPQSLKLFRAACLLLEMIYAVELKWFG
jgi:hypothetical protein